MGEREPAAFQWLQALDDASGIEGDWISSEYLMSSPVLDLIKLAAEVYLPFLRANADAIDANEKVFSYEVIGLAYSQNTFRYQAKCWRIIKEQYAALPDRDRSVVNASLEATGSKPGFA